MLRRSSTALVPRFATAHVTNTAGNACTAHHHPGARNPGTTRLALTAGSGDATLVERAPYYSNLNGSPATDHTLFPVSRLRTSQIKTYDGTVA